jgi:hypothetical protein
MSRVRSGLSKISPGFHSHQYYIHSLGKYAQVRVANIEINLTWMLMVSGMRDIPKMLAGDVVPLDSSLTYITTLLKVGERGK